ncbi:hypothetical protein ABC347_07695 [Sphingomonas sp. 1P06PA]|uniref:hypothetical protein n=1 Tax=Sphingomonas sp. 1P06PA TaxID=554121 RepID=UPI0039A5149F
MSRYNLILPLEGLAGSSVKDIARDMIAVSKRLDIPVSMNMNGTRLLAFPNSTMAEIQRDYEAQLESAT